MRRDGCGYALTARVFNCDGAGPANAFLLDLVAYTHHMRWLEMSEDNLAADIRDWGNDFT